tara:strand:- start:46 stop:348 length:303 start_codon:yes stop_codon:yes gene_type:complete
MSQALDFLKKLSSDDDLSKELQLCYVIATVKFASKKGYSFTPDEYLEASSENDEQTLEPDQLESVAGGVMSSIVTTAAVGEGGCGLPYTPPGFDWGKISF